MQEVITNISYANDKDLFFLIQNEKIKQNELLFAVENKRILVARRSEVGVGWLRWNFFWDEIPFMNMLYLVESYRGSGNGEKLVGEWEKMMKKQGYNTVMVSSRSDKTTQHFFRKLGYNDCGSLINKDKPLEIFFKKEL